MPITTTPKSACNANIMLADENGTMRDISGQSNSFSLARSSGIGDFVVFADDFTYRTVCKKDWSVTIKAIYSMGTDDAVTLWDDWWHNHYQQARFVQLNMPNNSIGSRRYDGYVVLESLDLPLEAGEAGPVQVTAVLQGSGELKYGTVTTS